MAVTVTYDLDTTKTEFTTNSWTSGDEISPDVLGLSGGGFVSAYANSPSPGVLLDFYDADHNIIGTWKFPFTGNTLPVGQPSLTELAGGRVLVVWDDDSSDSGDAGLKAGIFEADGTVVHQDVSLTGGSLFSEPDVAALSGGGFVMSYTFPSGVYARIYDADGVQQGSLVTVEDTTGSQRDSHVTALAGGGFVVTWTDENPSDQLIRGRVYNDAGVAQTAAFTIGDFGDNTDSDVAALPNGNFAVVYEDTGWSPDGLTLQIHTPTGTNVTPGTFIRIDTAGVAGVSDPSITVMPNGFIVVTWTYPFDTNDHDIHGRIFDQGGNAIDVNGGTGEFTITSSGGEDIASAVSALLGGEFITSWQDSDTVDGSGGQITSEINELTRTVIGDGAADSYSGDDLRDSMDGGSGDDTLNGNGGDDTILGGAFSDLISGGDGNDFLQGGTESDTISGDTGNDRIYAATKAAPTGSTVGDNLSGGLGNDKIYGANGDDSINGGDDNDKLIAYAGNDTVVGDWGFDTIIGGAGDDVLQGGYDGDLVNGGKGNDLIFAAYQGDPDASSIGDTLIGGKGNDTLIGSYGNDSMVGSGGGDSMFGSADGDTLSGAAGKDTLDGGADNDSLVGGGGDDRLTGGIGADTLTGGSKVDVFVFTALTDSNAGGMDLITDLTALDRIDLGAIDAKDTNAGNQAFHIVAAFTNHEGELVLTYHDSGTYAGMTTIEGDTNGDGVADITILAQGDKDHFTNFIL